MFAREERAIVFLNKTILFIQSLKSNICVVSELIERHRFLDKQKLYLRELYRLKAISQQQKLDELDTLQRHVLHLKRRLEQMADTSSSLAIVSAAKYIVRLLPSFILKIKFAKVKRHVSMIEKCVSDETGELSYIHADLMTQETQLTETQKSIDNIYENAPKKFAEGLDAPSPDKITEEELDRQLTRLETLRSDLQVWFEKLRNEKQQTLYKLVLEHVNVVGATCIGINTKKLFKEMEFDVVIVDESGQIQAHNMVVPLSRASKAILVGDHKQLPPVVKPEMIEELVDYRGLESYVHLYKNSWFEHLWDNTPVDRKVMLDEQFRCPAVISDYVSEAFYGGFYYAGKGMDKKKSLFSFTPGPMVFISTRNIKLKYEKYQKQEGKNVVLDNPLETKLVIAILKKALKEKPELATKGEVGIIVPYANHVKAIQTAIRKEQKKGQLKSLTRPLNEIVASVDSFQGQERDLIIFPFTRSNEKGKVGFLADWRRLNVAQTRAKEQLIMIGNERTLCKKGDNAQALDIQFKEAMIKLMDFCEKRHCLLDARAFIPNTPEVRKTLSDI